MLHRRGVVRSRATAPREHVGSRREVNVLDVLGTTPIRNTLMQLVINVGARWPRKNCGSHIDASLSRQPLVKGERLARYQVNAVMMGKVEVCESLKKIALISFSVCSCVLLN